jgi:hypothetical protein
MGKGVGEVGRGWVFGLIWGILGICLRNRLLSEKILKKLSEQEKNP